jgi:hypothetical protein
MEVKLSAFGLHTDAKDKQKMLNKDLTINFKDALLLFNVQIPFGPKKCDHRSDALTLLIFLCLTRQKIDAEHEQSLTINFKDELLLQIPWSNHLHYNSFINVKKKINSTKKKLI